MKYVFVILLSLFLVINMMAVLYWYGIFEKQEKGVFLYLNRWRTKKDNKVSPLAQKWLLPVGISACGLTMATSVFLQWNGINIFDFIKLMMLFCILFVAGIIDQRYHIIPNKWLIFGVIIRVIIYGLELLFRRDVFTRILTTSLIGCVVGFVFLLLLSVITRHAMGYGDVKAFALIGMYLGIVPTYSILLYSLLVCAICGIFLMVVKKKGRKYQMAFAPFIMIGYLIVLLLGGY